jgi:hypothetical protein
MPDGRLGARVGPVADDPTSRVTARFPAERCNERSESSSRSTPPRIPSPRRRSSRAGGSRVCLGLTLESRLLTASSVRASGQNCLARSGRRSCRPRPVPYSGSVRTAYLLQVLGAWPWPQVQCLGCSTSDRSEDVFPHRPSRLAPTDKYGNADHMCQSTPTTTSAATRTTAQRPQSKHHESAGWRHPYRRSSQPALPALVRHI